MSGVVPLKCRTCHYASNGCATYSKPTDTCIAAVATSETNLMLEQAIRDEEKAITDYKRDIRFVDKATARKLNHIMHEEMHHKQELTERLSQLR